MRRILALAAVTGLALTGLTSTPAAADNTIQVDPDVVINEVAVNLTDPSASDINYVELRNTTGSPLSIDGWSIVACDANGEIDTTILYGPIDDFKLVGDVALDADGGVALFDDSATPQVIHNVILTDPDTAPQALLTCLAAGSLTPEEAPSPTTSQVAERRVDPVSWNLDDPTPLATN